MEPTARNRSRSPIVWTFEGCQVFEYPDSGENGYLVTRWPDGVECPATRDHTMQNVDYAQHLGYTTVRAALREHELAHHFVSERLGFPFSPTLRAVGTGFALGTAPYELQLWEESVVLDFQRFLQTGVVGPALSPYAWLATEWSAAFRCLFRDPG